MTAKPKTRTVTRRVVEVQCGWCGVWFQPTTPKQIYHRDSCRVMAHRKAKAEAARTPAALKKTTREKR